MGRPSSAGPAASSLAHADSTSSVDHQGQGRSGLAPGPSNSLSDVRQASLQTPLSLQEPQQSIQSSGSLPQRAASSVTPLGSAQPMGASKVAVRLERPYDSYVTVTGRVLQLKCTC